MLIFAELRLGEVLFLESVLLCSLTACPDRLEKVLCFDVRIPQSYDTLRSHGEASGFKIGVGQLYDMQ